MNCFLDIEEIHKKEKFTDSITIVNNFNLKSHTKLLKTPKLSWYT